MLIKVKNSHQKCGVKIYPDKTCCCFKVKKHPILFTLHTRRSKRVYPSSSSQNKIVLCKYWKHLKQIKESGWWAQRDTVTIFGMILEISKTYIDHCKLKNRFIFYNRTRQIIDTHGVRMAYDGEDGNGLWHRFIKMSVFQRFKLGSNIRRRNFANMLLQYGLSSRNCFEPIWPIKFVSHKFRDHFANLYQF